MEINDDERETAANFTDGPWLNDYNDRSGTKGWVYVYGDTRRDSGVPKRLPQVRRNRPVKADAVVVQARRGKTEKEVWHRSVYKQLASERIEGWIKYHPRYRAKVPARKNLDKGYHGGARPYK